jgi:hypothetical protein
MSSIAILLSFLAVFPMVIRIWTNGLPVSMATLPLYLCQLSKRNLLSTDTVNWDTSASNIQAACRDSGDRMSLKQHLTTFSPLENILFSLGVLVSARVYYYYYTLDVGKINDENYNK